MIENSESNSNEENADEAFWDRTDAVIKLANEQAADDSIPQVAISLLYAAARYNVFEWWTQFEDKESFGNSKQEFIDLYVDRCREMLTENFQDYLDHFDEAANSKE